MPEEIRQQLYAEEQLAIENPETAATSAEIVLL